MRKRSSQRGYTLVEMMIVIVIIGILTTIILPQMVKGRYQAQFTSCQFNVRALGSALENYHTDNDMYPEKGETGWKKLFAGSGGSAPYIQPEPTCPSNNSTYGYDVSLDQHNYTVFCNGIHSQIIKDVEVGFPQYNPAVGLIPSHL